MIVADKKLEYWSPKDALVLKAVIIVLGEHLTPVISDRCYHVAGNGELKKAFREISQVTKHNDHVMKSDMQSYYASINHSIVFNQLTSLIEDKCVLRIIWRYLKGTVHYGGWYKEANKGISLGCSLSPLIAAVYLTT